MSVPEHAPAAPQPAGANSLNRYAKATAGSIIALLIAAAALLAYSFYTGGASSPADGVRAAELTGKVNETLSANYQQLIRPFKTPNRDEEAMRKQMSGVVNDAAQVISRNNEVLEELITELDSVYAGAPKETAQLWKDSRGKIAGFDKGLELTLAKLLRAYGSPGQTLVYAHLKIDESGAGEVLGDARSESVIEFPSVTGLLEQNNYALLQLLNSGTNGSGAQARLPLVAAAILLILLAGLVLYGFTGIAARLKKISRELGELSRPLSQGNVNLPKVNPGAHEFSAVIQQLYVSAVQTARIHQFAEALENGRSFEAPLKDTNDTVGLALQKINRHISALAHDRETRSWMTQGILKFTKEIKKAGDENTLNSALLKDLRTYVGAEYLGFFIIDKDEKENFKLKSAFSEGKGMPNLPPLEDLAKSKLAKSDAAPCYFPPADKRRTYFASGSGKDYNGVLILPVKFDEKLYGFLLAAWKEETSQSSVDLMVQLAGQLSLKHAHLAYRRRSQEQYNALEHLKNELEEKATLVQEIQGTLLQTQKELIGQVAAINNSASVFEFDAAGNFTEINENFEELAGKRTTELKGKPFHCLFDEAEKAETLDSIWAALLEVKSWSGRVKLRDGDEEPRWMRLTITPQKNEKGEAVKYIGAGFDATEESRLSAELLQMTGDAEAKEAEITRRAEQFENARADFMRSRIELAGQISALNNSAIVSETDPAGRIVSINEQFIRISKFRREELIGQNHRILKSGHQTDEIFEDLWKTISSGKVWTGEMKNRSRDGSFYWVGATITPVKGPKGRILKYIGVTFNTTPQKIQQEQLKAALQLSQQQESELRLNAGELQEAQAHMRKTQIELRGQIGALNNAGIVAETDLRGNIRFVNDAFCAVSGFTREELIGQNHRVLKSDEHDPKFFKSMWETIVRGKVWTGTIKNKKKNGEFYYVITSITPVMGFERKPTKFIGVSFETTELVRKEEQLLKSLRKSREQEDALRQNEQELLNIAIELEGRINALNNAGMVSETDLEGKITYVNDEALSMWGYAREEVMGKTHRLLKSGEHEAAFYKEMWEKIAGGEVWRGVIKNQSKEGRDYWATLTITPVLGKDKKPVKYIAVAYDISRQKRQANRIKVLFEETKKQEEELRSYSEAMEQVQQDILDTQIELAGQINAINNAAMVSETDLDGNITFINSEAQEVWGYSEKEAVGQNHRILKSEFHPPEFYAELWQRISKGKIWRGQIMNYDKFGTLFWVELTITPVLDDRDKPMKYIGISFDITEQKKRSTNIAEALRAAENQEKLYMNQLSVMNNKITELENELVAGPEARPLHIDSFPFPVLSYDDNLVIQAANDSFTSLMGYAPEEIIGASLPSLLFVDQDDQFELHEIVNNLKDHAVRAVTLNLLAKDGRTLRYNCLFSPLYPDSDKNIAILQLFVSETRPSEADAPFLKSEVIDAMYSRTMSFAMDPKGNLTAASDDLLDRLRLDRAETLGQPFPVLLDRNMSLDVIDEVVNTLNERRIWVGPLDFLDKDKQSVPCLGALLPIINAAGALVKFTGVFLPLSLLEKYGRAPRAARSINPPAPPELPESSSRETNES